MMIMKRICFYLITFVATVMATSCNKEWEEEQYVQLRFEYEFEDVTTNPDAPIGYLVKGSMTLQRDYNTQIPDEDQQIQWN